jgi:hypothetical protein
MIIAIFPLFEPGSENMAVETDERAVTHCTLAGRTQAYKFALLGGDHALEKEETGNDPGLCAQAS